MDKLQRDWSAEAEALALEASEFQKDPFWQRMRARFANLRREFDERRRSADKADYDRATGAVDALDMVLAAEREIVEEFRAACIAQITRQERETSSHGERSTGAPA